MPLKETLYCCNINIISLIQFINNRDCRFIVSFFPKYSPWKVFFYKLLTKYRTWSIFLFHTRTNVYSNLILLSSFSFFFFSFTRNNLQLLAIYFIPVKKQHRIYRNHRISRTGFYSISLIVKRTIDRVRNTKVIWIVVNLAGK